MSEEKKETKKERTPYSVKVEPINFNADFSGKYVTSTEFCHLTNAFFHAAFADYDGCQFLIDYGKPVLNLYFAHGKTVEGDTYACARSSSAVEGNSIIDKTRSRDMQMKEGDRYHLTDDGIDIIRNLLLPNFYNQGKPKWSQIVTDVVDNSGSTFYNPQARQLTKVIGIDPKAICKIIYGDSEDGSKLDYGIEVKSNLSNGMANSYPNYVLSITKAYTDHIAKTYENFGFGMGSNIIR